MRYLGDEAQRERYARREASLCVCVITSMLLTAQRVIRGHCTRMGSQEQWAFNVLCSIKHKPLSASSSSNPYKHAASDNTLGCYGNLGTTPGRQEGHTPLAVPSGLPQEVVYSREQVACPYRLLQGTVGTSGLSELEEIHPQGLSPGNSAKVTLRGK
jgi:hypothetical protein